MTNSFFNFLLGKIVTLEVVQLSHLSGVPWSSHIVECRKFEAMKENTWSFLLKNGIFEP